MENVNKLNKCLKSITSNEKSIVELLKLEDVRTYVDANSLKAIAKESKASLVTVKKYLQPIKNELKAEKIELALELNASGIPVADITKEIGQSVKTIQRWIENDGVMSTEDKAKPEVAPKVDYKALYEALMIEHKALLEKLGQIPTTK